MATEAPARMAAGARAGDDALDGRSSHASRKRPAGSPTCTDTSAASRAAAPARLRQPRTVTAAEGLGEQCPNGTEGGRAPTRGLRRQPHSRVGRQRRVRRSIRPHLGTGGGRQGDYRGYGDSGMGGRREKKAGRREQKAGRRGGEGGGPRDQGESSGSDGGSGRFNALHDTTASDTSTIHKSGRPRRGGICAATHGG